MGKNALYGFMASLSVEYKLSKKYTNHCVRSTCITQLDHHGIESRHIMEVSGHKSETSIKSYSKRLSDDKKRQISEILSENIPAKRTNIDVSCPNQPDFLEFEDEEFENLMSTISTYELNTVEAEPRVVNLNPQSYSVPPNFNFSNCNVNIHLR